MSYLIDTNVLSELRRKQPAPQVVIWLEARPRQSLYLSVLTLGEIRKGIERVQEQPRKQLLLDWLEVQLPQYFMGRVLGIDAHTADRWGRLMADAGRPLPAIDALLAATALQHDLTLVTRNTKDFLGLQVRLVNPWENSLQRRTASSYATCATSWNRSAVTSVNAAPPSRPADRGDPEWPSPAQDRRWQPGCESVSPYQKRQSPGC